VAALPAEWQRYAAAAVAHQVWALSTLQGSILDVVWTYGTEAT
jgi:predicted anti-sigma-YlaC factor YlaD